MNTGPGRILSLSLFHTQTHTHPVTSSSTCLVTGMLPGTLYALSFWILMTTIFSRNCFPLFSRWGNSERLHNLSKIVQLTDGKVRMENKVWLFPRSALNLCVHDTASQCSLNIGTTPFVQDQVSSNLAHTHKLPFGKQTLERNGKSQRCCYKTSYQKKKKSYICAKS